MNEGSRIDLSKVQEDKGFLPRDGGGPPKLDNVKSSKSAPKPVRN